MRGLLGRLTRGLTGAGLSGSAPRGCSVAAVSSPPPPSYTLTYAPRQTLKASCSFVSSAVTQAGRGALGAPLHGSAWTMPTMPFAASGTVGANRSTQRAAPGGTRAKTTGIGLRVMNGDVDRAMRKLKRLMIQEGYFRDRDKRKVRGGRGGEARSPRGMTRPLES